MAINVLQAAKQVCKLSNWELTNLELQKILYICHMLFMGQTKKPLIRGEFQAWDYGPVHPKLYDYLKCFGADSIPKSHFSDIEDLDKTFYEKEIKILDMVSMKFPHPSGPKLIKITHWGDGAWNKKYKYGTRSITIEDSDILEEYNRRRDRIDKKKQKEAQEV